ncbi:hypothetical protein [Actinoplanes sp. NPDC051851]|uniref:hypothetical protein n=1 Tax=Actinoplanes sp. NPDC051851 TaxID=3154753 RepID=UPI00344146CC
MGRDGAFESLTDVLGDRGAAALIRWAGQENRSVRLTNPRWTASGYTGAVLAAIIVGAPGEPDRQVIVKVCPPGQYAEETVAHREALAHSDRAFFAQHLVDLAFEPFPIDGGDPGDASRRLALAVSTVGRRDGIAVHVVRQRERRGPMVVLPVGRQRRR